MPGSGEDRHYYDFEFEALVFSFFPFIPPSLPLPPPPDLTAGSHHKWCLKDVAKKTSVSVLQLVSQAADNFLAHPCLMSSGKPDSRLSVPTSPTGRVPWAGAPTLGFGGGPLQWQDSRDSVASVGPLLPPASSSHLKVKEASRLHISSDMKAPRFGGEAAVSAAKLCVSRLCDVIYHRSLRTEPRPAAHFSWGPQEGLQGVPAPRGHRPNLLCSLSNLALVIFFFFLMKIFHAKPRNQVPMASQD